MSSENTLTGRNGKFKVETTVVARTTQWECSESLANTSTWGDSDSEGYTNRAAGRKDAKFSAEGKYDSADEVLDLFAPGDIVAGQLYVATGSEGASQSLLWDFPRALNTDFKLTVNIDSEEVIGWTSDWGPDGRYYRPGETAPT